jgi:transketolase
MRNAFIDELVAAAEIRDNVALVVGDLGYDVIEPFAKRFPKRFFNAGVAEQNMMGLAAGLASEGFHVFAYSIANFPTFRCAEQIRNDVDYHNLPVTIVAVGGGLAYGNLGYSHHAVQDYALIRVMPNMLIAAPGDPMEVRACMRYLINNPQPSYLRLGKAGEPCIHTELPEVSPGRWLSIREGEKRGSTYLTTGATLDLVNQLIVKNPNMQSVALHSMPLWSMKTKESQSLQVGDFKSVITVEDHLMDGGFGSWLLESSLIRPDLLARIKIKSLDSKVCGMVAKQSTMNALGGLSEQMLCA